MPDGKPWWSRAGGKEPPAWGQSLQLVGLSSFAVRMTLIALIAVYALLTLLGEDLSEPGFRQRCSRADPLLPGARGEFPASWWCWVTAVFATAGAIRTRVGWCERLPAGTGCKRPGRRCSTNPGVRRDVDRGGWRLALPSGWVAAATAGRQIPRASCINNRLQTTCPRVGRFADRPPPKLWRP